MSDAVPRAGGDGDALAGALLRLDAVETYYDRSYVLQGLSLEVREGEVVALLGRNGAGKSTTLKSIMGIVAPRRGRVLLDGTDIAGEPPYRIARRGLAYVPEERGIFPSLTVEEHLTLVAGRGAPRASARGRGWSLEEVYALFPRLHERRRNRGNELSGGEQQMLSIARALVLDPRLLLLDEPTEGLAPVVVNEIASVVESLTARGLTMLLVEQNYPFALRLAGRVYVLGKGVIRWQGTGEALERDAEIKQTWLGV